jgi:hypothetical protein
MQHSIELTSNCISSLTRHWRNEWTIRNSYSATKFKNELWRAFEVVDEKQAAERWLHILKMNKLTVKYAAEFQQIAALTDWDDDTLVLQYYWELNKTIKDEIVRMNWSEELQNMINIFHQHWQLSMKTMDEAYRTLHIKGVRKTLYLKRCSKCYILIWDALNIRAKGLCLLI